MRTFSFKGVAAAAVTPFTARGALDLALLADLIAWWIAEGIEGLLLCGSTGEMAYLSPEERVRAFEAGAKAVRGRVPLIAGTGFADTPHTVEVTRAAAELGAAAALVVTPYYYPLDEDELVAHYTTVAQSASLPVLLYNMPPLTHVNLDAGLVQRLAQVEGIAGIKDSAGDLDQLQAVRAGTPGGFCVLTGSFSLLVDALAAGADGAILAMACLIPSACVTIRKRVAAGQLEAARAVHREHAALQAWVKRHGIPGIKRKLTQGGHPAGWPRRPLQPLA